MEPLTQFRPAKIEPAPSATQLAALSFASAISGMLSIRGRKVRVVLHRVINRLGIAYLQQTSPYAGTDRLDHSTAGRVFSFTTGVMGYALLHKQIAHTRKFQTVEELEGRLRADMKLVDDKRSFEIVARSYLAIPMLGADEEVATLLYADSMQPGVFANASQVKTLRDICQGFCNTIDQMVVAPLPYIENFPMQEARPAKDAVDVYPSVQELLPSIKVPRYKSLLSFNLETKSY